MTRITLRKNRLVGVLALAVSMSASLASAVDEQSKTISSPKTTLSEMKMTPLDREPSSHDLLGAPSGYVGYTSDEITSAKAPGVIILPETSGQQAASSSLKVLQTNKRKLQRAVNHLNFGKTMAATVAAKIGGMPNGEIFDNIRPDIQEAETKLAEATSALEAHPAMIAQKQLRTRLMEAKKQSYRAHFIRSALIYNARKVGGFSSGNAPSNRSTAERIASAIEDARQKSAEVAALRAQIKELEQQYPTIAPLWKRLIRAIAREFDPKREHAWN